MDVEKRVFNLRYLQQALQYVKTSGGDIEHILDLRPTDSSYTFAANITKDAMDRNSNTSTGRIIDTHRFVRSQNPLWRHLRLENVDDKCLLRFTEEDTRTLARLLGN
uniref:Uncharacterized protein n=1 Tax=Percolomonas cosmopolitus TaxID=63605 RepID=A0A7S1KRT0_9EUKA